MVPKGYVLRNAYAAVSFNADAFTCEMTADYAKEDYRASIYWDKEQGWHFEISAKLRMHAAASAVYACERAIKKLKNAAGNNISGRGLLEAFRKLSLPFHPSPVVAVPPPSSRGSKRRC